MCSSRTSSLRSKRIINQSNSSIKRTKCPFIARRKIDSNTRIRQNVPLHLAPRTNSSRRTNNKVDIAGLGAANQHDLRCGSGGRERGRDLEDELAVGVGCPVERQCGGEGGVGSWEDVNSWV